MPIDSPRTPNVIARPLAAVPLPAAQERHAAVVQRVNPVSVTNVPALPAPPVIPPADYRLGRFQVSQIADGVLWQAEPAPDYAGASPSNTRHVSIAAWSTELNANNRIIPVPTRTKDGP